MKPGCPVCKKEMEPFEVTDDTEQKVVTFGCSKCGYTTQDVPAVAESVDCPACGNKTVIVVTMDRGAYSVVRCVLCGWKPGDAEGNAFRDERAI